jgi:hypothetical protein
LCRSSEIHAWAPVAYAMLLSLYLIPLVMALMALRRPRELTGALIVLTYVFPLILLTMLSSPGYALPGAEISEETANVARAALHLSQFGFLTLLAAAGGGPLLVPRYLGLVAAVSVLGMAGSVLVTRGLALQTAGDGLARALLLAIQAANVFLLIPHAASASGSAFFSGFARAFVNMALGILVVAVISFVVVGPYPEWAVRVGRPLNPRVLAEVLVLGLFLTQMSVGTRSSRAVFAFGILATGSRLSIAILSLYVGCRLWTRRDVGSGLAYILTSPLSYLLARTSILAARWEIWRAGLRLLGPNWLWGTGERFVVADPSGVFGVLRMHNSILESLLSHGIIFATAVLTVYLLLASRMYLRAVSRTDPDASRLFAAGRWIIATAIVETLFGTAVWTNLGDGISVAWMSFLSSAVVYLYIGKRVTIKPSSG